MKNVLLDKGIILPSGEISKDIRPIEPNGKWGLKQRRVYELDEDGNRIRDADGNFVFNAVPTPDWGSPETLEYWRQTWAELCNAKFAEKGLDVRIDHRSYERQGVELLPTVHEGATVRAMEKKGIRTEKGEFNRWIKATNGKHQRRHAVYGRRYAGIGKAHPFQSGRADGKRVCGACYFRR